MGTNYYVKDNICKCCERHDLIHIGKNSAGWVFIFNGMNITTVKKWSKYLAKKTIIDEYGKEMTFLEFWDKINYDGNKEGLRLDAGFGFLDRDFS